jgi:hypothetical protein
MISTSVIPYGNNLQDPVPQPGWQVEIDGFGLMQAQVKFKWDYQYIGNFPTKFAKGTLLSTLISGVESRYANMSVWKASMTTDKANVVTVTADLAGIDPNINGGQFTEMQMVMTGASSSEPIEHHPNFLIKNCVSFGGGNVLAGFPKASGWDDSIAPINPATGLGGNPNRALWTPKVANGGATQGQQFVGFLPNQSQAEYLAGNINIKAGIKNYYKPQITLRGLWYHSDQVSALDLASYVGWTTDGTSMGMPENYRKLAKESGGYSGNFQYTALYESKISRDFLITNCSVEQFGNVWKVNMDFLLSGLAGWDPDVYPPIVA